MRVSGPSGQLAGVGATEADGPGVGTPKLTGAGVGSDGDPGDDGPTVAARAPDGPGVGTPKLIATGVGSDGDPGDGGPALGSAAGVPGPSPEPGCPPVPQAIAIRASSVAPTGSRRAGRTDPGGRGGRPSGTWRA